MCFPENRVTCLRYDILEPVMPVGIFCGIFINNHAICDTATYIAVLSKIIRKNLTDRPMTETIR